MHTEVDLKMLKQVILTFVLINIRGTVISVIHSVDQLKEMGDFKYWCKFLRTHFLKTNKIRQIGIFLSQKKNTNDKDEKMKVYI